MLLSQTRQVLSMHNHKFLPSSLLIFLLCIGHSLQSQAEPPKPQLQNGSVNQHEEGSIKNEALARSLIETFYSYLSATGSPTGVIGPAIVDDAYQRNQVKSLLDKNVIIQRADGDFFNYTNFYPIDIDEYKILNIKMTRPRSDLLVVAYDISTPGATSLTRGLVNSSDFTPRLTTFRFDKSTNRWLILSHASYNQPIMQICNQPLITTQKASVIPNEKTDNYLTAKQLIDRFYSDLKKYGEAAANPGGLITQKTIIMTADGSRRTGDKAVSVQFANPRMRGFLVSGDGNDLVVRYEFQTNSRIGGVAFTENWQPRLATFSRQSKNGQWTLASFANFNYPSSPSAKIKCVNSTTR